MSHCFFFPHKWNVLLLRFSVCYGDLNERRVVENIETSSETWRSHERAQACQPFTWELICVSLSISVWPVFVPLYWDRGIQTRSVLVAPASLSSVALFLLASLVPLFLSRCQDYIAKRAVRCSPSKQLETVNATVFAIPIRFCIILDLGSFSLLLSLREKKSWSLKMWFEKKKTNEIVAEIIKKFVKKNPTNHRW